MTETPGFLKRWRSARRGECAQCGEQLSPRVLPHCSAHFQEVSVAFTDLPCLGCSHPTHPKRLPDVELGERLIDALFETGDFPAGKQRPFGGIACRRCGASVKGPAHQGGTATGELSFPGLSTFRITVSGPMVRCEVCGLEQIHGDRETANRICEAMAAAFRRASVQP